MTNEKKSVIIEPTESKRGKKMKKYLGKIIFTIIVAVVVGAQISGFFPPEQKKFTPQMTDEQYVYELLQISNDHFADPELRHMARLAIAEVLKRRASK